ncbi:ATP-binding cassette domain-containing protein [Candidatus Riflebacteria bacterium]
MIEIENLSKTFNAGLPHEKKVLKNVNLSIASGSTQFLLGGNGAGKTTILRIISTLLSFEQGKILVNSMDVEKNSMEIKRSMGFFSANTGLYERLNGREFLDYFAILYGLESEIYESRLKSIIDLLKLQDCMETKCLYLSSGQKQKVNIARALIHDPPIYIMDEPTLGLDIETSAAVLDFIIMAQKANKTLLIVTHNMDLVQNLGGQIAFLVKGEIAINTSLAELYKQSNSQSLTEAFRFYEKKQTG